MVSDVARTVSGPVLSLFRVVVGLLFTFHGMASLWGLFAKSAVQFGVWPSWYAAVIEFVGGVLVLLGVGSRVAALICSGSMAYAYFVVHQSNALLPMSNGGEAAALFSWAFLLIAVLGPGPYALDALFKRRQQVTAAIEGVEG